MTLQVWERAEAQTPNHGADDRRSRGGLRRLRWPVLLIVVLALVVTAVVVGVRRAEHRGVPLDPQNPGREGSQALARVLADHGVPVQVVRGEGELLDSGEVGADTTLVVTNTGALSDLTARTMLDHASRARRVVLVQPSRFMLGALDLPADGGGSPAPTQEVRAGCTLEGLAPSDAMQPKGRVYASTDPRATTCFTFDGRSAVLALPAGADHPEVVILGNSDLLTNSGITALDHAGIAVRMLGQGSRLVWYVPSQLDIVTDAEQTPTSEIPRALWPLTFLALFGLLALMVWRGRRFGPLVTEPLPAVVKAIETTQSRGRLYRKSRDTARAGAVLRARTTRRLAALLALPPSAAPAEVAQAAAVATGRDPALVAAVLAGAPPSSEAALVALAADLSDLEKDVRRP